MKTHFKSWTAILPFALAILMLVPLGCSETDKGGEGVTGSSINFIEGYEASLAAGKMKNQPILIDFYTDWCRWCKVLDTVTYVDSGVIALSDKIVFGRLNAEVDTIARKNNSITGFPSLLLFDSEGKEIDRIVGYLPPDQFIETINNSLNGIGTMDYYKTLADSAPTPEVYYYLAGKYNDRGRYEEAESYYQKVITDNPDNEGDYTSNAMMSLAGISMSLDNYDEAVTRYEQLKMKFPDSAIVDEADIMIAIAYKSKGDTATAIKAFEDYLGAHPNSPDTGYARKQIEKLNPPPPAGE
jgi:thioredoxin-like negative regulator of GroEL